MLELENHIKLTIAAIHNSSNSKEKMDIFFSAIKELPKTSETISLFQLVFDAINKLENPDEKRNVLFDFLKEIPAVKDFLPLYLKAAESAIEAADSIKEPINRKTKLLRISKELPQTEEFTKLRIYAMRLLLDLAETPHRKKASLDQIAWELPKSSDIAFYRRYTLLGIASELPKTGEFINLYKEAIQLAIDAVGVIKEPYYREYALLYIAKELPKTEEYLSLYKQAMAEAFKAASIIHDQFAREHALIDILQEIPKTAEFFPLIQQIIKQALEFYTVKKRFEYIEIIGRFDYFIAGEARRLTESKKIRYTKEKYAMALAKEIERSGLQLNDIRLVETLQPYTHIWIQPLELRLAARKIVGHLEGLRTTYHGREIERPIFVSENHPASYDNYPPLKEKAAPKDCIAIDLGATNTVIMRRSQATQPDFILLGSISKHLGDAYSVPTILSANANSIGMEAIGKSHITNIKKMLLDDNPKGREYMESYIRILYQHLKKAITDRRFLFFSSSIADTLYLTVPVGFQNYRKTMKEIAENIFKGVNIEFIEEPLAAAIGYQVAEERDKIVVLIDFGGCTLNTMILRLNINEVHVVAKPDRAKTLGGHDIDIWLAEYLSKKIGISNKESTLYDTLILKAEEIKIALSEYKTAPFEWDGIEVCKVSRDDLEGVLAKHDFYKIIDRAISYTIRKAEKVGIGKDMIETVLLTGGSSQIPSFKEKIDHIFPKLREQNAVYDHSPLSAVVRGAALYGTRNIIVDRHLGMAYAVGYTTKNKDAPYSYKLILESGESLPLEKTFKLLPAMTLGIQNEIYLELFEVPESMVARRWVIESGVEFIKQEIKHGKDMALKGFNIVTLTFKEPVNEYIYITFCVNEKGYLTIRYGKENIELETCIRLR
ncbi:MAG: Hsp70 family protein [Deltaproteobacteria bacterium]|nr:Hsp70 family protein [Deltaproteobacteria bacterium]